MPEGNNFLKQFIERLLKESFTIIVLSLVVFYFMQKLEEKEERLFRIIDEDRQILEQTLQKRNEQIFEMYEERLREK